MPAPGAGNTAVVEGPAVGSATSPNRRWASRWGAAGAFVLAFGLDQIAKSAALRLLASGSADLGPIHFHLVANRGIVMGFPAPTLIVVLAAIGVAAMALRESRRRGSRTAIAWWLVAGGAFGNLTDRFLQRSLFPPNAVVDWISLGHVTFNLADVFVVFGAILLLFGDRRRHGPPPRKLRRPQAAKA